MIEIAQELFGMVAQFINWFFTLEIDLYQGQKISIGQLIVLFLFVIVALYLVLSAIGVVKGGGEND